MSDDSDFVLEGRDEPVYVRAFDLREFRESGLLFLANRTLHVYGLALAVTVAEDGTTTDLAVVETTDPLGFTFPEDVENESRERLFAWLRKRLA